jgi:putative nucleotidyltransferase with HDIG domain
MTVPRRTGDADAFRKEEFRLHVEDLTLLPAISPRAFDLMTLLADPEADMVAIAGLIEKDPGMSARVLKVANSPLYAPRGHVTRMTDALVRVGLMTARGIILTASFFDSVREHPAIVSLWKHSMTVSFGARKIGEAKCSDRLDEFGLAGLLHDIGKVVYPMFAGETFEEHLGDASPDPGLLKEMKTFGMDHSDIGNRLAESWNFPPVIYHAIRHHHAPDMAPAVSRDVVCAVGLADRIACAYNLGHSEDPYVEAGIPQMVEDLGVSSSFEAILASVLEYGDNIE